ncbi:immunity 52 family protein [Burkholderia sp. FERM BP-3421]|uniref:immunity 52 family protein n=1 Tax=Burkholderia sp. FERM BP-3421 TaxID=1494466 RepID=UPI002361D117|nr:immunity 52 family protein [Burkholderia sp. FERM BP-3421]WDD93504.1 immunity 52 family protein [Burkholderia sp. FERM BP-3421]
MKITSRFRDPQQDATDLPRAFGRLGDIAKAIHEATPQFSTWYLTGNSKKEALLYPAFEDWHATTAALAVLRTEFEGAEQRAQMISLWDGGDDEQAGAKLTFLIAPKTRPKKIEADFNDERALSIDQALDVVRAMVATTAPAYITVEPHGYAERQVFDDKPGVGWMLYLPIKITQRQLPEARALVPVVVDDQTAGTVIVSVADDVFSIDNPEHVEIANRIEIRLADQDLLPTYTSV